MIQSAIGMLSPYSADSTAALSSVGVIRRLSRCSASPPNPHPSSATEIATNAKWYQIVAE